MTFTYKGYPCELAHEKFGLRLRIGGDLTEEQADGLLTEMRKKLVSAVRTVEALLAELGDTLNAGNVTVVNQHRQLRRRMATSASAPPPPTWSRTCARAERASSALGPPSCWARTSWR